MASSMAEFTQEEIDAKRYRGMNPAFVRRVWAKRREENPPPERRGAKATKWMPEDKARIADMMTSGMGSGEIAKVFGVTPDSIAGVVKKSPELKAIGFQTEHAKKIRGELPSISAVR